MTVQKIRACTLAIACALVSLHSFAQDATSGAVTGHVTCADTQQPARFAYVTLIQVPTQVTEMPNFDSPNLKKLTNQLEALTKKTDHNPNEVDMQTDIEGEYVASGVPPGDYYVFASQAGYVSPRSIVLAAYENGVDLTKGIEGVSVAHVVVNRTVTGNVLLQRGAAITGTVMWDDGSPVPGAIVTLKPAKVESKTMPVELFSLNMASGPSGSGQTAVTNDRGEYRLFGLEPDDYVVQASEKTVSAQHSQKDGVTDFGNLSIFGNKPLVVYAPAALHKSGAKPVTLHVAEELHDESITINLSGMHTVSGHVESADEHHGVNYGSVTLQDTQDEDFVRTAMLDANGDFKVTLVPSGSYTMSVGEASDRVPSQKKPEGKYIKIASTDMVRSYEDSEQPLTVVDSDITGQLIDLTPEKKKAKSDDEDTKP